MTPTARWRRLVVPLCAAIITAFLGGCSSGDDTRRAGPSQVVLRVHGMRTSADTGALVPFVGTLSCREDREVGGEMFTGRATQLCERLRATPAVLQPRPKGGACAQVFGGPETAEITGRIDARTIDVAVSRTDACGTAQWERLQWLLGPPQGA